MEANEFENNRTHSDSSDASIPEEFKHFTSDIGKEEDYKEYIVTNHVQIQEPIPVVMRQHPRNGNEPTVDSQAYIKDFDRSIYTQQGVKEDCQHL